ncbi:hypothetical protein LJB85_03535 [Porphyromonadaceae bacterium OttesenSCG-928-L07]|nr:hypothetical protein [Porphyromonadaceae bacterium OttesenSCG-928-L07]MDL2251454.1 hypothetical protein [Odoribacter sp. OttesenSCG-928-J03]MDL2282951.1 hypothetical protein [Odoribacter sp. OttesenSCG-928-G04]
MKTLGPKGMKTLKTCHVLFAMIWVVGVIAMAVINLIKPQSGDELYMTLYISRFIDDILVIPGAILTVITAIIYGLHTNWGFFKHNWITVKWIVSIVIILIGTFYFSPKLDASLEIADLTRNAALSDPTLLSNQHISLIGAFIQAGALVVLVVISVFKPWKKKKVNFI